jgi:hypothetical protein
VSGTLETVSIPVEIAIQSEIKAGYISCPVFARLLDLFNGETDGNAEFFELVNSPGTEKDAPKSETFRTYFRKSAVDFIAVTGANLARGLGSNQSWKAYPFVPKYPIHVSLQLKNYNVIGTFHLSEMQTVQELLNEKLRFIPITEATISSNGKLIGTRPFVILNKEHILISREKTALPVSKYNYAASQG